MAKKSDGLFGIFFSYFLQDMRHNHQSVRQCGMKLFLPFRKARCGNMRYSFPKRIRFSLHSHLTGPLHFLEKCCLTFPAGVIQLQATLYKHPLSPNESIEIYLQSTALKRFGSEISHGSLSKINSFKKHQSLGTFPICGAVTNWTSSGKKRY